MLMTSREAREVRAAMGVLAFQIAQLTAGLEQLHKRVLVLEDPTAIKIAHTLPPDPQLVTP